MFQWQYFLQDADSLGFQSRSLFLVHALRAGRDQRAVPDDSVFKLTAMPKRMERCIQIEIRKWIFHQTDLREKTQQIQSDDDRPCDQPRVGDQIRLFNGRPKSVRVGPSSFRHDGYFHLRKNSQVPGQQSQYKFWQLAIVPLEKRKTAVSRGPLGANKRFDREKIWAARDHAELPRWIRHEATHRNHQGAVKLDQWLLWNNSDQFLPT